MVPQEVYAQWSAPNLCVNSPPCCYPQQETLIANIIITPRYIENYEIKHLAHELRRNKSGMRRCASNKFDKVFLVCCLAGVYL